MTLSDNPLKWLQTVDPSTVNAADLRELETILREQRQAYDDLWEDYLKAISPGPTVPPPS